VNKALEILKTTDSYRTRIAVLNMLLNLAWKNSDSAGDNKVRMKVLGMNLVEVLTEMKD
jgi:hypothetical protein